MSRTMRIVLRFPDAFELICRTYQPTPVWWDRRLARNVTHSESHDVDTFQACVFRMNMITGDNEYNIAYLEVTRRVPQGEKWRLSVAVWSLGKSGSSSWADAGVKTTARGCPCAMNTRASLSKVFCLFCSLRACVSLEIWRLLEMTGLDVKRSQKDLLPS